MEKEQRGGRLPKGPHRYKNLQNLKFEVNVGKVQNFPKEGRDKKKRGIR